MNFQERSYSVLVVSASEKFNASLSEVLTDYKCSTINFETSVSAAKRAIMEREYDFILINSPLPDEDGIRFAIDICSGKHNVVMIMVRNELYPSIFGKVSPHGVYLLSRPTSRQLLSNSLDWMATTRERLRKMEKKTISLEDKMAEIRIVNRAKWLLISQLKMSETDAHRYIEKQAMDRCISKKEVAEGIINTYS